MVSISYYGELDWYQILYNVETHLTIDKFTNTLTHTNAHCTNTCQASTHDRECIHACTHTHTYTHMHKHSTRTHIHVHNYTCIYTHTRMHTRTIYIHMYLDIHIHMYMYMYSTSHAANNRKQRTLTLNTLPLIGQYVFISCT